MIGSSKADSQWGFLEDAPKTSQGSIRFESLHRVLSTAGTDAQWLGLAANCCGTMAFGLARQ